MAKHTGYATFLEFGRARIPPRPFFADQELLAGRLAGMSETTWPACADSIAMFEWLLHVRDGVWFGAPVFDRRRLMSRRKLRLFFCACCRRAGRWLSDVALRALLVAEEFADGRASAETLRKVHRLLWIRRTDRPEINPCIIRALEATCKVTGSFVGLLDSYPIAGLVEASTIPFDGTWEGVRAAAAQELAAQAELLRHIYSNPFRPAWATTCGVCHGVGAAIVREGAASYVEDPCLVCGGQGFQPGVRPDLPSAVMQLAEALYAGADCHFAVHDALLDNGQPELAEHFAAPEHPKGCWLLDLILEKV